MADKGRKPEVIGEARRGEERRGGIRWMRKGRWEEREVGGKGDGKERKVGGKKGGRKGGTGE
jgi:hypothetical protein